MADPASQLVSVTGVTRDRMLKIWEEVKENVRKLDSCPSPHHRFLKVEFSSGIPRYVFCSECGGRMDIMLARSYRSGFAAAGGKPEEVMPERLLRTTPA